MPQIHRLNRIDPNYILKQKNRLSDKTKLIYTYNYKSTLNGKLIISESVV